MFHHEAAWGKIWCRRHRCPYLSISRLDQESSGCWQSLEHATQQRIHLEPCGATRDFVVGLHQFQTTNAVCQSVQIYSDQQVHQILKCSSPVFFHQLVFQGLGTLAHEIDLFACLLTLTCS